MRCTSRTTRTRSGWAEEVGRRFGDAVRRRWSHRHGNGLSRPGLRELAHPHPQQAQPPLEVHALEALARGSANLLRVGCVVIERQVPRSGLEVVEAQLDADGAAHVTLALQVLGD